MVAGLTFDSSFDLLDTGRMFDHRGVIWPSGGAGFVASKAAIKRFVCSHPDLSVRNACQGEQAQHFPDETQVDDLRFGKVMTFLNISMEDVAGPDGLTR